MKKITFLTLFCLAALGTNAQNFYNFTKSQAEYANLENSISINNGQVWDYDTFSTINIPFSFSIGGQTVNRFLFEDDYFAFAIPNGSFEAGNGIFYFYPSVALIQDRTYSTNVSTSPLSYKIEGETGNRILKLEIKNAGIEDAVNLGFNEDFFYINIQVWLYEADNTIEIRYGANNITDIAYVADPNDRLFAGIEESDTKIYVIYGENLDPTYGEFVEANLPDQLGADAFPSNGTVYRLAPTSVAGVPQFVTSTTRLYPNPASNVVNLKSDNVMVSEYAIYNILGKLVAESKITETNNAQINIESLEKGIYFVKANNHYLKFIKN
ncbi:T9SS type A sorting domain-containing protein [Flavobacterium sp. DG1-102-2]|uniref:T9SS type A sorting domain-containing protein n=1 Tax=Flavobacterium sp. DG1-102-2 TaxID=3081663 RepID=UPI002949B294|nr:T9SS type A sorting domain-containing protein [Flavobacterium sp. DG1-102-2]MDV6167967.1 T9SS type A sorting domain-containing protein [Flavobacterium sp. DG1-102-2]